jgi:DNA-binding transcriptional ArsR family regulator
MDAVFKALADPSRRLLLDRLRQRNGQSLLELCAHLDLTRPAVAKHLGALEKAGLLGVQWRGREKRHYLNTAPLFRLQERWLDLFQRPEQMAAQALKKALEKGRR